MAQFLAMEAYSKPHYIALAFTEDKRIDEEEISDNVIKDLERDAPEVMAKVAKEEEAKQWNTSYPSKADYNAAADPIAM